MSASERDRLPLLADGVAAVRRSAALLAVLVTIGALVGAGLYALTPTRYLASSRVALAPRLVHVPLDPDVSREREVTLDTTAALARADRVVREISLTTGLSDEEVRARLSLSARPASRVLVIGFRGDTREQAESASHTAVEALLALQDRVLKLSREQVRLLRNQVNLVAAQTQDRIEEGADPSALAATLALLQDRLDRTVETTRTRNTVVRRTEVLAYRAERPEVLIGTGAVTGLGLALLVRWLLSSLLPPPRRRSATPPARGSARPTGPFPLAAVVRSSLRERPLHP